MKSLADLDPAPAGKDWETEAEEGAVGSWFSALLRVSFLLYWLWPSPNHHEEVKAQNGKGWSPREIKMSASVRVYLEPLEVSTECRNSYQLLSPEVHGKLGTS